VNDQSCPYACCVGQPQVCISSLERRLERPRGVFSGQVESNCLKDRNRDSGKNVALKISAGTFVFMHFFKNLGDSLKKSLF
jgi:hypothetical protein